MRIVQPRLGIAWPQRLAPTWSLMWIAAAPAFCIERTARATLMAYMIYNSAPFALLIKAASPVRTVADLAITLQIEIGTEQERLSSGLAARPIDDRDLAYSPLVLGQLRGRNLPVAVAKFADQLARGLDARRSLPRTI